MYLWSFTHWLLGVYNQQSRCSHLPQENSSYPRLASSKNFETTKGVLGALRILQKIHQELWPSSLNYSKERLLCGLLQHMRHSNNLNNVCTLLLFLLFQIYLNHSRIETDASKGGIGKVISQQGNLIAYISKILFPKNQLLSVYEQKILAILFTIKKWEHYLCN